jgi:hypothetical protein
VHCEKLFVEVESWCVLLGDLSQIVSIHVHYLRHALLTLNDDISGLDGDLDPLGDFEQFLGVAIPNVSPYPSISRSDAMRAGGGIVGGYGLGRCRGDSRNAATAQSLRWIDVHVLHLEGCCGLVVSTEDSLWWEF